MTLHAIVRACVYLMFEGIYRFAKGTLGPLSATGMTLLGSYEAEQHIAHFGRSNGGACWTISGLLSGFLSRAADQEIYVLEESCIGAGATTCQMYGRTREQWGSARNGDLLFFRTDNLQELLDETLHQYTSSLKEIERKLNARRQLLTRIVPAADEPHGIIARSPAMARVVDLARRVASVDSTVLVTGESGTGKELISRYIHEQSIRAAGPFVAVNCGAISDTLLDSELFGHRRGAFTGANQDRIGLFEAANSGTLLLDEISEVSPALQVSLLRVLQERQIRRIGENITRDIDVRIIAATNEDLAQKVARGAFRKDLYYRLNIVELHIPPLRDRREDILPLARVLLLEMTQRMNRQVTGFSPRAADQLLRYTWPGNVRELANAVERAVALSRVQLLEYDDLPEEVREAVAIPLHSSAVRTLAEIERDYILSVLDRHDGNRAQTAEQLGIGTATLYRKLKEYAQAADVAESAKLDN